MNDLNLNENGGALGLRDSILFQNNQDREWLENTLHNLISININPVLIFRASVDGFASSAFHQKCDNKGPTVVLVKTGTNHLIGGYSSLSWTSPALKGRFFVDPNNECFLFSVSLRGVYKIKMEKYHICCNQNYGPIFGNYDLLIPNNCDVARSGNNEIGTIYDYDGRPVDFYGRLDYLVKDYEVWTV